MSGKGYQRIFIVVLLNFNILGAIGETDESNEESQPNYEYVQIFKSLPALFEYLLDALEERPEILEKNDVNMFNRNMDLGNENGESSDDEKKTEKRDVDCEDSKMRDELVTTKDKDKRDTDDSKDLSETTVAYEYGNSNIVMKDIDELDNNKVITKRMASNDDRYSFVYKETDEINMLETENRQINGRMKRNVLSKLDNDDINDIMLLNYGQAFFGFEHLFGLDLKPEEIEERILTAEKLLEDHNNNKDKKRVVL